MFCKNCGNQVADNVKFCPKCGQRVAGAEAVVEVKEAAAETVAEVKETAAEAVAEVKEAAAETVAEVKETAAEATAEVKENVAEAAAEVKTEAAAATTEVKAAAAATKETVENTINNAPKAQAAAAEKTAKADKPKKEKAEKTEKKAGKKFLIPVIIIAVVAVLILANLKVVANGVSKLVLSPEKYYAKIEKQQIKELASSAADIYNNGILEYMDVTNQSVDYDMNLVLSESALKMLENAMGVDDVDSFSKMGLSFFYSMKGDVFSAEAAATMGKTQVISANAVADLAKGEAYVQVPELSSKYIGMEIDDYTEVLTEALADTKEMAELLPKKALVEDIINNYLEIAVESFDSVTEKSAKVSVGEIEVNCTNIRIRLKEKDCINMMEAICKEAENDKDLIELVSAIGAYTNDMDPADVEEQFKDAIADYLDRVEDLKDEASADGEIEMNLWVDNKGEVIGRELKIVDSYDNESVLSYQMPQKGSNYEFEAVLEADGEEIKLTGTGKKSSSSLDGEFVLKMTSNGKSIKLCKVVVEDFDTKKIKQGYLNGSFDISLTDDFYDEVDAVAAAMLSDYSIKYVVKTDKSKTDMTLALMDKKEEFASIAITAKIGSGKSASVPKNGILVEDEEDLIEWVESVDMSKFIKTLNKAGLPEDLVDEIEDAWDDVEDMMEYY